MKKIAVICFMIIFCLIAAGCGNNKNSSDKTSPPDGQTTSTPEEEQVNDLFTVEGEVVGLIDNNSFEAMISVSPVVFRLENAASVFEEKGINDGDIVKIGYILDQNEQKVVKTIEKSF